MIKSLLYNIFANVITYIITTILGLLLNKNVQMEESAKKRKLMFNAILKIYPDIKPSYLYKLQKGLGIMRTILLMSGSFIKRLNSKYKLRKN